MATNQSIIPLLLVTIFATACILIPACGNKQPKLSTFKKEKKEKIMRYDTRYLTEQTNK